MKLYRFPERTQLSKERTVSRILAESELLPEYDPIHHVLEDMSMYWFLEDKARQAREDYNRALERLWEWKRHYPKQYLTQSVFARRCLHEMIGAYTRWLIFKKKEVEGNPKLAHLYLLFTELPPHSPQGATQTAAPFSLGNY